MPVGSTGALTACILGRWPTFFGTYRASVLRSRIDFAWRPNFDGNVGGTLDAAARDAWVRYVRVLEGSRGVAGIGRRGRFMRELHNLLWLS
jgi:hypothetical protein